MSILPFKKKDNNQEFVRELDSLRTQIKQLKLREKKIIVYLTENVSKDKYIYNFYNQPIAKLNVSNYFIFDPKAFKEKYPKMYDSFQKESSRTRWEVL